MDEKKIKICELCQEPIEEELEELDGKCYHIKCAQEIQNMISDLFGE